MAGRRSTGAEHDGRDEHGRGEDGEGHDGGPRAPRAGDEVAGVRLSALVGEGGAGAVWSGTEVRTGDRVAVKLLRGVDASREAALLTALRHPHVLPLRRISADPPALVTDLASGGSLAAQVAARGRLTPGEVVTVLAPLGDALAALHAQGVVHGDLTASNVLFVDKGRPVLADLGVAGLAGDGEAWATPGYAAPEVLGGARPGPAADVHGLGAAAWLALTGAVPPGADDRLPLRLLAPDCPDGLVDVVTAALDPDPARRPAPDVLAAAARASGPGRALRLVPAAALGVRPDEAVTSRVREAAAADLDAGEDRGWRRRRWPAAGPAAQWAAGVRAMVRGRRSGPSGRRGGPPGGRTLVAGGVGGRDVPPHVTRGGRRAVRPAAAAGAAVAVLAVVAVTGALLGVGVPGVGVPGVGVPGVPGGPGPDGLGRTAGSVPSTPAAAQGLPSQGLGSQSPPSVVPGEGPDDLQAEVTGLVAARERALRAGDEEALAQVHHPDGTTWEDDRAVVGAGPLDVGYEVLRVRPVAGRADVADVDLRTTTSGVSVVEHVTIEVAPGPDGWRVRSVTAPRASGRRSPPRGARSRSRTP